MTNVESAVIARLKKQGHIFEVLVDCEKAISFREGNTPLDDVLVTNDIFKDVKKGEHASEHHLKEFFQTKDNTKVAEIIIKNGEIQLTTEYKNKLRDKKRKQIVNLISRNAVDPSNNLPHPPQRIENALNEAKVKIDEFHTAEEQIKGIVKSLTEVIPIKYEIKVLSIKLPPEITGQSYPILKRFSTILKEKWLNDGSLLIMVEVPSGLQNELFDNLNNLSHGKIEIVENEK